MLDKVPEIRPITINKVHNGYVVQVGCTSFVFEKAETLINHLTAYLEKGLRYEMEIMGKEELCGGTYATPVAPPTTVTYAGMQQPQCPR